jgi:hypothetical protein
VVCPAAEAVELVPDLEQFAGTQAAAPILAWRIHARALGERVGVLPDAMPIEAA